MKGREEGIDLSELKGEDFDRQKVQSFSVHSDSKRLKLYKTGKMMINL